MTGMIVILLLISIAVITYRTISKSNRRRATEFLRAYDTISFEKINIDFLQSSVGKGAVVGGWPISAVLYYSDDLILIVKEDGLSANLPLVIAKAKTESGGATVNGSAVVPGSFKVTSGNSITLKYQREMISKIECSIRINLLNRKDFEKIRDIIHWC